MSVNSSKESSRAERIVGMRTEALSRSESVAARLISSTSRPRFMHIKSHFNLLNGRNIFYCSTTQSLKVQGIAKRQKNLQWPCHHIMPMFHPSNF
jgi:hypothetical protein